MIKKGIKVKEKLLNAAGLLWNNFDIPRLGYARYCLLENIYKLFPLIGGVNYPRLVEWQFVLNNFPKLPAEVLDVGATTSLFPFKLNALGYKTHCLDQRLPNFKLPERINFHRENLMDIKIESNCFDAISCISVIEHVGMGLYNDPVCSEHGDIKAVKEMLRILKPSGNLVITTNICKETIVYNNEIRYGKDKIKRFLSMGKVKTVEYRFFDSRRWQVCDETVAFDRDAKDFGIAMFVLSK